MLPNIYRITMVTAPGPSSPSRNLRVRPGRSTDTVFPRSIHVSAPLPHLLFRGALTIDL